MKHSTFHGRLVAALVDLKVSLTDAQLAQLEAHWRLVLAWNARTNLTAITDDAQGALMHYRDSLEAIPVLPSGAVVDLGSGAGYPGVPLAIAEPERQVTLVEPRAKRASFLKVVAARLGLPNVRVLQGSSQDEPDRLYAAAVSRATFSSTADLTDCLRWVVSGGLLVAFRSEPTGAPGSNVHRYELAGQPRVLEIWRR